MYSIKPKSPEHERAERRRVLKGVKIAFKNSHCSVNGIIKNQSETGAMIQIEDTYVVPNKITMFNDLEGYKVDCEVMRRVDNIIGVKFISEKEEIKQTRYQVIDPIQ